MDKDLKSKAIKSVFWSSIERYSVQIVQFILGLIMARLLNPDDYGLIAMLAIFLSISQIFIDGGFSSALIQKKVHTELDYSTAFYINLSLSILFYIILFYLSPWIADFYNQPLLKPITRIYSLNLILNSVVSINKTKLTISLDFKTQSKISFTSAILSGILGVYCAYIGFKVWSLVIQILASACFNIIFCFYYVRWFPKFSISKEAFKGLFSFGSKLLIAQIISTIYNNIYTVVIGKKFDSANLGYYSRADQFCCFINNNLAGVLSRVAFPMLSQIQNDDITLLRVYKKYIQTSSLIMFPLIVGLCGVAKPLIYILLTSKWSSCILLLQILCFAYLFDCIVQVNLNLIYVKGRSDLVLKLEIVKKSIAFIILIISLFFNLVGICIGRIIYSIIAFYLNTYYTNKILNYGFKLQVKEILPNFLLSLIVLGESLALSYIIEKPIISLASSLLVCSFSYIGLCEYYHIEAYLELKKIIINNAKSYRHK